MQRSPILKIIAVFACSLVILIALFSVSSVISDRQKYRDDAVESISASYASAQKLVGPVLAQPYTQTRMEPANDANGKPAAPKTTRYDGTSLVFPKTLAITGDIKPSERHHGLYSVTVYELQAHIEGDVDVPEPKVINADFAQPYLVLALADFRGIVGRPVITVNGQALSVEQSARAYLQPAPTAQSVAPVRLTHTDVQLVAPLPFAMAGKPGKLHVVVDMTLAGTQSLRIAPVADLNEIKLKSTWPSPLFSGSYLPRTREVSPSGFNALWQISSLASATQQQIPAVGDSGGPDMLQVSLLQPIDPYKLTDRATKYGVLFILLTFGSFFVFEVLKQSPIHPVQYLLVGFGLVIFFLLLISFSEHMPFGVAYTLASIACIVLITFYLTYVLKRREYGLGFGAMLAMVYAAVYGLLISEDNALLLGALLLFAALAAVMFVTRRVDWYKVGSSSEGATVPPVQPNSITGTAWNRGGESVQE